MSNDFYQATGNPATRSQGQSSVIRAEFDDIEAGFDKMPTLTGNARKAVVVNPGATALGLTDGTLTLAGNFATVGANAVTLTTTGTTTLTLPTTGTLATLAGAETLTNKTISGTNNTIRDIANISLVNALITVNGTGIALGGSGTITAAASSITLGATAITNGTNGNILYKAAGVINEMTTSGSGTIVALANAPSFTGAAEFLGTVYFDTTVELGGALRYGGVTLTAAVTGTGSMVLSASPTLTGNITFPGSGVWTSGGLLGIGKTPTTAKLETVNTIDGTPGTASSIRIYNDGSGFINGLGTSSGAFDFRSVGNYNFFTGATPTKVMDLTSTGELRAISYISSDAGTGYVIMVPGTASQSGHVAVYKSSRVRLGYLGFDNTDLTLVADSPAKLSVIAPAGITITAPSLTTTGTVTVGVSSSLAWSTRSQMISAADGFIALLNAANTAGLLLNFSSDAALVLRNRANSANASLTAGAATFSGAVAIGNTASAVSPTAPNRTVTVVVGGVTLYLHAKTTND